MVDMDAREPVSLAETPDGYGAFLCLRDAQIETLAEHGEQRRTRRKEVLFREGDESYDFFVILEEKRRSSTPTGARSNA
jgi:thioredoxin reductase (NADPH)